MTDEPIIEAVDVCRTGTCKGCPYHELYTASCINKLMKDVCGLIARQKAEIERLEKESADKERAYTEEYCLRKELKTKIKTAKSEAIKEFAEALKESADNGGCGEDFVYVSDIDILVKEMTEEQK